MMPKFTVITATWNRSHHIIPTIKSVLAQTFTDFEYLIIGDCCSDDTEEVVRPFLSDRVRWLTTTERWNSQSGPNNLGIQAAKGDYIALIGHDDIWSADNLANHFAVLSQPAAPEFSVTGCIKYGCPNTGLLQITGMFAPDELPERFFFVPSSFALRKDAAEKLGPWRKPDEIALNVDVDYVLRAHNMGMRFVSTQKIGAHKFVAAQRYLSYLQPESWEQHALQERIAQPEYDAEIVTLIAASKAQGTFAVSGPLYDKNPVAGANAANSRLARGVDVPTPTPLKGTMVLAHGKQQRGQDWHPIRLSRDGNLHSGPNPTPKLLIPVTAQELGVLEFDMLHANADIFRQLSFRLNGEEVTAMIRLGARTDKLNRAHIRLLGELKTDAPSILQVFQPASAMLGEVLAQKKGVAIGPITITFANRSPVLHLMDFALRNVLEMLRDAKSVLPVVGRRKNP